MTDEDLDAAADHFAKAVKTTAGEAGSFALGAATGKAITKLAGVGIIIFRRRIRAAKEEEELKGLLKEIKALAKEKGLSEEEERKLIAEVQEAIKRGKAENAPKHEYMPSAEARTRGLPNKGTPRYKQLVNKEKRLNNELAAGGNRGVAGKVNSAEADFLGERFVGQGFTERVGPHGERILISKDGLRQYRSPTSKLSEHATTGRQANFQSRTAAEGAWENNVHFNVED